MSYSANMAGLDLFMAPFISAQASRTATASRPQQPKPTAPQRTNTTAPPSKSAVSPTPQPQPVEPKAPAIQSQEPDIQQKPVPEEKTPVVQPEQTKSLEPEKKPQAKAPEPEPEPEQKSQAQPESPKKELTMDMSDRSIPAGKPLDASEDAKRKAHEKAEAKRKAEWEAKQREKKEKEEAAIQKLEAMTDADAVAASTERVRTDVEKLTRRNMKECVAEHIQSVCKKDPAFARRTMHPKKSMIHCFKYINRKAKDYIQQEMEDNDIKPENGIYGGDVPDDLCYQWAEDYFNDSDAQEDQVKEEEFIPRPYVSTAKSKKISKAKKTTAKKESKKQPEPKNDYKQMSLEGIG